MSHFTLGERKTLAKLLQSKISYQKIGFVIEKAKSSISDEIKNNSTNGEYDPEIAHAKAIQRKAQKTKRTKLTISPGLKKYVIQKLSEGWSPKQIYGDLRRQANGKNIISHETIYQFIYSNEGKELKLWLNLRHRKKPERIPWGSRKRRIIIPERVSIQERPSYINLREEFGHYEGDLMIFSSGEALAVFTERVTRKTFAVLNTNKSAPEMELALHELISSAGQTNVRSITFDNGGENVCHAKVRVDYAEQFDTYFCDPYCSWQKGLVENTNKLLRQYLPRDAPQEILNQDYVDEVVAKLNSRPCERLGYNTPDEEFKNRSV